MGCGGTGKSFIINTIISIVRNMTQMNDTIKVGAPSGAAAYNIHGSTLHRLLGISVSRPEEKLTGAALENLQECLKHLLCLIIDERSMLNSKFLAAAEKNVRHSVYKGQNSGEIWGGVLVVLLFGDDYQLFPIIRGCNTRVFKEDTQKATNTNSKIICITTSLSKRKLFIHKCHVGDCIHT